MKFAKALVSLMVTLVFAGIVGTAAHAAIGINPIAAGASVPGFQLSKALYNHYKGNVSMTASFHLAAIQQEFWVEYIMENLFKDNDFMMNCFNESDYVLAGSVVHIPQAGAVPAIVKNRSSYPATAVQRTDTDITYPLDVYTSDPVHITDAEQKEISYDKMGNVLSESLDALRETIADDTLIKWAPSLITQMVRTTGADTTDALSGSATGTRKKFMKEDLKSAARIMDLQKIPKAERFALVPEAMKHQLLEDSTLLARDGIFGGEADLKRGIIGTLYGFTLMSRTDVLLYTNAATPVVKALGSAGAATDNQAVLCWQKNQVAKAMGTVDFFENKKDALYYGDIYSGLVKMGARKRRSSGAGVVAIIQAV